MDQLSYLVKEFNDLTLDDIFEEDRLPLLATINHLFEKKKLVSAPCSFETNNKTFKCLENLLKIRVRHFIELVNCDVEEGKLDNAHVIAACLYREDWSKDFSEEETIENAKLFHKSSCNFSLWGLQKFEELVNLLRHTYPILYEKKPSAGGSEGRRAYSMLNGLAKDDPTKWEEAQNLELWTAFAWMEEKEIQRENEKKQR